MKKYPVRVYSCDKTSCPGELEVVFVGIEPTDVVQCPTCKEMTAKWNKDRELK